MNLSDSWSIHYLFRGKHFSRIWVYLLLMVMGYILAALSFSWFVSLNVLLSELVAFSDGNIFSPLENMVKVSLKLALMLSSSDSLKMYSDYKLFNQAEVETPASITFWETSIGNMFVDWSIANLFEPPHFRQSGDSLKMVTTCCFYDCTLYMWNEYLRQTVLKSWLCQLLVVDWIYFTSKEIININFSETTKSAIQLLEILIHRDAISSRQCYIQEESILFELRDQNCCIASILNNLCTWQLVCILLLSLVWVLFFV